MAADFDTGGTTRQTLTVGTLYKTIAFFQFDKMALLTVPTSRCTVRWLIN
jgi:hypothetical protein